VLFAAVPNPFFDIVGVVAGSLSYPARRFLVACIIGNITKYLLLAFLGKTVADLFG
jgi:membrane protein YqaA with SNARE-associated domain